MKLRTIIFVPSKYSLADACDISLKRIDGILYNAIIGQEIMLINNGKQTYARVIGVSDSVYDDAICRYVEVVVIDTRIWLNYEANGGCEKWLKLNI